MCYFPPARPDERCFLPTGVCIMKTVKGRINLKKNTDLYCTYVKKLTLTSKFKKICFVMEIDKTFFLRNT